jgi:hypothetical protein
MQMLLSLAPGIFLLADAVLEAGQNVTDEVLIKLNANSKFATVRKEVFDMGYYKNADQSPAPVSPIDGSDYGGDELIFIGLLASASAPAAGFIPGQSAFPSLAPFSGQPIVMPYMHSISSASPLSNGARGAGSEGAVTEKQYVNTTSPEIDAGVSRVLALAQRLSVEMS